MNKVSLSTFCRENGLVRDEVKEWLIENGYLVDIYHATELGKNIGISTAMTRDGNPYLVYNGQAQDILREGFVKAQDESGQECAAFPRLRLKEFVILDTETTGLRGDDEVVELGMIDSKGNILYQSLFRPQKQIHYAASKVNGLFNKDLVDEPLFKDEWENIKNAIGSRIIIGHNIAFDKTMIMQTLARYDMNDNEAKRMFRNCRDSMVIARQHLSAENYRLETLCRTLGIVDEQKHRACDDCLMVLRLLEAIEQRI